MTTAAIRYLTRRSLILLCTLLFSPFVPNQAARADEIAIWNFNDSDLLVDHGAGSLNTTLTPANILFAAGTSTNARQGDSAGQALSLQGGTGSANNGRNITIAVSTVGFSGISVSFSTQGSGTGFNSNQFQYSLDGTTFFDLGSPYVPATAFGSVPIVFDLTSIVGLNNNPNAAFRIVFNGATSATGTNRIDNLVVDGTAAANTAVPEPTAMFLLGSGLASLSVMLRRRETSRPQ